MCKSKWTLATETEIEIEIHRFCSGINLVDVVSRKSFYACYKNKRKWEIHRFSSGVNLVNMVSRKDAGLAEPKALPLVPTVHTHLAHRVELTLLKSKSEKWKVKSEREKWEWIAKSGWRVEFISNKKLYLQWELISLLGTVVKDGLEEGSFAVGGGGGGGGGGGRVVWAWHSLVWLLRRLDEGSWAQLPLLGGFLPWDFHPHENINQCEIQISTYQCVLWSFWNLWRFRQGWLVKVGGGRSEKNQLEAKSEKVFTLHLGAGLFGRGRDSIRLWSFECVSMLLFGTDDGWTPSPKRLESAIFLLFCLDFHLRKIEKCSWQYLLFVSGQGKGL